jgi:hypothetical protein
MANRFRRFVRDVLGRADEATIAQVQDQLRTVCAVVELVRVACRDGRDIKAEVDELAQQGSQQRSALTRTLSSSLTTPIDREDLARLSRSIDDVLHNLRDFVREFELYAAPDPDAFGDILDAIANSLAALGDAVAALADGADRIVQVARTPSVRRATCGARSRTRSRRCWKSRSTTKHFVSASFCVASMSSGCASTKLRAPSATAASSEFRKPLHSACLFTGRLRGSP